MRRRHFAAIAVLGISLAASVAARPGIYEYWKAGTRRGRSKSTLPQGHARAQESQSARTRPRAAAPWTEAWFSDSALVRRHLARMTEALTIPMIGETYPLPRGGGFVCAQMEGGPADSGLTCMLQCTGPELGGRRDNWFYVSDSNPRPTLDRVRWSIHAPQVAPRDRWRALFLVLADSLSGVMGRPVWTGEDRVEATWRWKDHTTTVRFFGTSSRVDSLEMECVSDRLAKGDRRDRAP